MLGEALQPSTSGVTDIRMELPAKEAGWDVDTKGVGGKEFENVMRLFAFLSDVYLSE